jgi:uncharacterized membrane protein
MASGGEPRWSVRVRKAQAALTNGAHERLTDMLDAARERTMHTNQAGPDEGDAYAAKVGGAP